MSHLFFKKEKQVQTLGTKESRRIIFALMPSKSFHYFVFKIKCEKNSIMFSSELKVSMKPEVTLV